jgi:hypothetical protein
VNIKTINGKTLLGEGDLVIEGGAADLSGYATEEYVDAKVGESYPIYYPLNGEELTEEQKAVNKEAYDVLVAAFGQDASDVPHVYPYDLGKQFTFIPYEFIEDEGCVVMFLNIDATPAPFSDLGLSLSGTGLHTISQGFQLYSDGRVTNDFSGSYIIPDFLAVSELVNGKKVQTRWLYASIDGSISDSMKEYNKETIEKIANGENIKLAIWPIYYPVEYNFEDGDGIVFTVSVVINDSLVFGQGVINSDGSCEYEEYTFAQGGGLKYFVERYVYEGKTEEEKTYNLESLAMAEQGVDILWAGLESIGLSTYLAAGVWYLRLEQGMFVNILEAHIDTDGTFVFQARSFCRVFMPTTNTEMKEYMKAFFKEESWPHEQAYYGVFPIISWSDETETSIKAYFLSNGLAIAHAVIDTETGEVGQAAVGQ